MMSLLDKDELLSKLGLETTPSFGRSLASALGPFGIGMLVGAGIALLLTPRTGKELRDQLGGVLGGEDGLPPIHPPRDGAVPGHRTA